MGFDMTVAFSRRLFIGSIGAAFVGACTQPQGPSTAIDISRTAPEPLPPAPPTYAEELRDLGVWFTPPAQGKAILVNIPSYELVAFKDGEPVMTSRVIVGTRRDQTPVKSVNSGIVRFRPSWRPTPEMVRREGIADRVHPAGRRNPLGLATIRFDDGSLVYLHGTNNPKLFQREKRALSHGCIRVEKLTELVAWTLDWPEWEVEDAMNGRRTFDVDTSGFPIHIGYYTKFKLPGEEPREYADIYRHYA